MIATDKHIIKHQIIDVHFSNEDDHDAVCKSLSASYKQHIGAILDEICEELFPSNPLIQIDSLEIDLGSLPFEDLGRAFPKAIKASLKEALFKQMRDEQLRMIDSEVRENELSEIPLLFYLRTGRIPWNFDGGLSELKQRHAGNELSFSSEVISLLRHRESRLRVIQFFDEQVLFSGLYGSELIPKYKKAALSQFEILQQIVVKLQSSPQKARANTARTIVSGIRPGTQLHAKILNYLISPDVLERQPFPMSLFPLTLQAKIRSCLTMDEVTAAAIFSSEETTFMKDFLELTSEPQSAKKEPSATEKESINEQATSGDDLVLEDVEEATNEELKGKSELKGNFEPGESLLINNAGLVLVWPYLQAFFSGLKLMNDKEFIDEAATVKAVHLLHYLVFENTEGDETQWVLNKLLCGMHPEQFVPEKMALTETEKEECTHLLEALIKNWPVIKNTRPDSLRQTFLQRDGLLTKEVAGWLLRVERQTLDILLDRLTWTISAIKLPWNDYMIQTEW